MDKLNTIQKRENLNIILTCDEKGPGNAYHDYLIRWASHKELANEKLLGCIIPFQKGPRHEQDSKHGVIDTDLLEIVRHRLQCFQEGEYATRENAIALTHIEEALLWMNKRVEDRIERNVLGTYEK